MTSPMLRKSKKKILFIAATHGDEGFSIEVLKKLDKSVKDKKYDWLVANEEALKIGKRFVDCDLNRVAPCGVRSAKYEERRAAEILAIARDYQYVIDLHGTRAETGIFVIVTNPTDINLKLAAELPLERIVIWPSNNTTGPITKFVKCGIEIECGPKELADIAQKTFTILRKINDHKFDLKLSRSKGKEFYQVTGKLSYEDVSASQAKNLKEFEKVDINGESIYPLLIGRYPGWVCQKLERVGLPRH